MTLSKEVCQKCAGKEWNEGCELYWQKHDRVLICTWGAGIVHPSKGQPPNNCPYHIDHMMREPAHAG